MTSPGKFENNDNQAIAEYLYNLCSDGHYDEQFGSVTEPPFFWEGLITLDLPNSVEQPFYNELNWSYILVEDSQGFFTYQAFEYPHEAEAKYFADLAAYESYYT